MKIVKKILEIIGFCYILILIISIFTPKTYIPLNIGENKCN